MNLDRDNHAMRAQFQDAIENLIYGRGWRVMGAILLILILFLLLPGLPQSCPCRRSQLLSAWQTQEEVPARG